jgi:integrase
MSVYKPKGSPYYHYDFQKNGQRFFGSTRTANRAEALKFEKQERARAATVSAAAPASRMTLDVALGEYWERHARHRKSANDMEIKLERLNERLGKNTTLSDLSNKDIADYIAKRREEVKPASVNREIVLLRAALFYVRDNLDAEIPKINWKTHMLPEPKGRTRVLTEKEETKLMAEIREDYRPLIDFCLLTGCQVSSARNLKWKDISGGTVRLYVKSKIEGDHHDLPVTKDMKAIFDVVKNDHPEYVFTYKCIRENRKEKGKRYPFTETNWRREWKRALDACKIRDFRFHDLRHTAGTRILREKKNLAVVQRVLGHKDITSTLRYAHVLTEDVHDALTRKVPKKVPKKNKIKANSNR